MPVLSDKMHCSTANFFLSIFSFFAFSFRHAIFFFHSLKLKHTLHVHLCNSKKVLSVFETREDWPTVQLSCNYIQSSGSLTIASLNFQLSNFHFENIPQSRQLLVIMEIKTNKCIEPIIFHIKWKELFLVLMVNRYMRKSSYCNFALSDSCCCNPFHFMKFFYKTTKF